MSEHAGEFVDEGVDMSDRRRITERLRDAAGNIGAAVGATGAGLLLVVMLSPRESVPMDAVGGLPIVGGRLEQLNDLSEAEPQQIPSGVSMGQVRLDTGEAVRADETLNENWQVVLSDPALGLGERDPSAEQQD